jgi:ATPase subunit of ABC transporter with duplicated ATPase domains
MNQKLRISRFTQHFEDKLDLSMTPIDFFKQKIMPQEPLDKIRPLLGRYGCGGDMQSQVMSQLSAGQKARIVFAIVVSVKNVSDEGCFGVKLSKCCCITLVLGL